MPSYGLEGVKGVSRVSCQFVTPLAAAALGFEGCHMTPPTPLSLPERRAFWAHPGGPLEGVT